MAYGIQIRALRSQPGTPPWELSDIPWWDLRELMRDPRFHDETTGSGYVDYHAELSREELLALHKRFEEKASSGPAGSDYWSKQRNEMLRQLETALAPDSPFQRFSIRLYEWESGLG